MINKIKFPKNVGQHYYRLHYQFLLNVFKDAGIEVEMCPNTELDQVRFTINIDGKYILIDFSDHTALYLDHSKFKHIFKFHYEKELHEKYPNIYPLSPISFYNWSRYFDLWKDIKYTCNNDIVLNNQRPYAGALQRRRKVQYLLTSVYKKNVDLKITDQLIYWKKINNCLVGVFVPGARNDMLDRGQLQFMAFGACTISPKLNIILPYNQELVPGFHYLECKADYSDLIEKIEWCKKNRQRCIEIGQNAKHLFMAFCLPRQIVKWMERCINKEIKK